MPTLRLVVHASTVYQSQVQGRGKWDQQRLQNDRVSQVGAPLRYQGRPVRCARCRIAIGHDMVCDELYAAPVLSYKRARGARAASPLITWTLVCAWCATEDLGLAFGYCLVAKRDWEAGLSPVVEERLARLVMTFPLLELFVRSGQSDFAQFVSHTAPAVRGATWEKAA